MKKETRKTGLPSVCSGVVLSSVFLAMRRCVYLLMTLCVCVTLQAHGHHHHEGHVCSHDEHSHAECSHPQQSNGEFTNVYKCTVCSGSGHCFMCGGAGMIYSFMGMTYCPGCMGTGKCQMCHGAGSIVISGNTNTGVGSVNGQTVVVPVHGNGNNGSSSGTSSSSRVCRVCNGTGLKISEPWMGSQTSQRKWCSTCGKYVLRTHQHVRCDNCNGTGRVKY